MPLLTSRTSLALMLACSCCCCWPVPPAVAQAGVNCKNRMDLVIAVDAASSPTASLFEDVKSAVKGIAAEFTVGPNVTRLALLRITRGQAQLVANLDQIVAVADFNSAVDRLAFDSEGVGDLAEGLRLARTAVLTTARVKQVSKVVLLVKDRRSALDAGGGAAGDLLRRVTSEAAGVRGLGAAPQAVGVGGLWNWRELEALFGTDYLLFKSKQRALESVKSLRNLFCDADCPDKGKSAQLPGLCNDGSKHVVSASVSLGETAGLSVCRREINRSFITCNDTQRCNKIDRVVGPCNSNGKVSVESMWQIFDFKLQSCVTTKTVQIVDCADSLKCTGQVADVIFLLDRSTSMEKNFPSVKRTTKTIVKSLTVDPKHVRVSVITFESNTNMLASLTSNTDMASILGVIDRIPDDVEKGKPTYTDFALKQARREFHTNGRQTAERFVFLITDGESSEPDETFKQTALIKNDSVTLYAIGIGKVLKSELSTLTEPESDTNMIIVDKFSELEDWAANFSKRICVELSAPNPKLCADNVFMQSVSRCTNGRQQVTKTEYKYDGQLKCIKSIKTIVQNSCRNKCIDPLDGNEYLEGTKWTNRCHEFECRNQAKPLLPKKSYCLAADGQCKPVGSAPFKCMNEKGGPVDNCQCIMKGGKLTLLIETH